MAQVSGGFKGECVAAAVFGGGLGEGVDGGGHGHGSAFEALGTDGLKGKNNLLAGIQEAEPGEVGGGKVGGAGGEGEQDGNNDRVLPGTGTLAGKQRGAGVDLQHFAVGRDGEAKAESAGGDVFAKDVRSGVKHEGRQGYGPGHGIGCAKAEGLSAGKQGSSEA